MLVRVLGLDLQGQSLPILLLGPSFAVCLGCCPWHVLSEYNTASLCKCLALVFV